MTLVAFHGFDGDGPRGVVHRPTPVYENRPLGQQEELAEGVEVAPSDALTAGDLATTMVLRGAVGTLIGAASAPRGREGIWGAAGFVLGASLGEIGIVGVALAALWQKA